MTFTYDPSTDIGKCRLLVRDITQATAIFQDEDYAALLDLEGDIRLAAAAAIETIAGDQILTLKVLKAGSASLDGASVGKALLQRAAVLREQAGLIDPTTGAVFPGFDIAEMVVDGHSYRERVGNEALRDG